MSVWKILFAANTGLDELLILLCSPRRNGVTDHLARYFAAGAQAAGGKNFFLALRDFEIKPCLSCGKCRRPPHQCVYSQSDDAEIFFSRIIASRLIVCASPIYFYALPGYFKCLIDRGQRYWQSHSSIKPQKYFLPLLAAGRPRGNKLFSGSLLTLAYFFKCFNARLAECAALRGLETPVDITSEMKKQIYNLGHKWTRYCFSD